MQRQLHLQRLQEQEREMQMRFEQQKQLTQIRQMQAYGYPQVSAHFLPCMDALCITLTLCKKYTEHINFRRAIALIMIVPVGNMF